jgi:hypothetical protein
MGTQLYQLVTLEGSLLILLGAAFIALQFWLSGARVPYYLMRRTRLAAVVVVLLGALPVVYAVVATAAD